MSKKEVGFSHIVYIPKEHKIDIRCYIKITPKTLHLLERDIEKSIYDTELGKDFLDVIPKAQPLKEVN